MQLFCRGRFDQNIVSRISARALCQRRGGEWNPRPFWSRGIVVEKTASVNHPQLRMVLSVRGLI
jgi:hypothetical protein